MEGIQVEDRQEGMEVIMEGVEEETEGAETARGSRRRRSSSLRNGERPQTSPHIRAETHCFRWASKLQER